MATPGLIRGRLALLVAILISGCVHLPPLHKTPKHHVEVHINADVGVDEAMVNDWVDRRVDEWIAHKVDWKCEKWSDQELEKMCQKEPVIVYAGYVLGKGQIGNNSNPKWAYLAWNFYDYIEPYINVTIDYPALRTGSPWDPDYVNHAAQDDVLFSFGVRELPHEWTHTARGAWHPEK